MSENTYTRFHFTKRIMAEDLGKIWTDCERDNDCSDLKVKIMGFEDESGPMPTKFEFFRHYVAYKIREGYNNTTDRVSSSDIRNICEDLGMFDEDQINHIRMMAEANEDGKVGILGFVCQLIPDEQTAAFLRS